MSFKDIIKYFFSSGEKGRKRDPFGYSHWYETDTERLKWEVNLMHAMFPQLTLVRLRDGRLAFHGSIDAKNIAVVFPYLYPIEPPLIAFFMEEVQDDSLNSDSMEKVQGDSLNSDLKEEVQGDSLNGFFTEFTWQTNKYGANILREMQFKYNGGV